jgi:hypothetical protein
VVVKLHLGVIRFTNMIDSAVILSQAKMLIYSPLCLPVVNYINNELRKNIYSIVVLFDLVRLILNVCSEKGKLLNFAYFFGPVAPR